jgi:hypothetical protein
MKRHLLTLSLLSMLLTLAVFSACAARRQACTCVLGGADYFDPSTSAREDCLAHGMEMP